MTGCVDRHQNANTCALKAYCLRRKYFVLVKTVSMGTLASKQRPRRRNHELIEILRLTSVKTSVFKLDK